MEKAAFAIYLITLILSPLLFGAVHTYAYTMMTLGVLTGSLLLVKKNVRKNLKTAKFEFRFLATSLNFAFFILLVFLFFQLIPFPDFLLDFLSPEAKVVGEKSFPASQALISENRAQEWFALSPYYYPVRMSIIRWTVYGLFFIGFTQVLNSQKRIELAIFLILLTGCFEALYGLIQAYSGSGYVWWFKKPFHRDVSGTYINRDHFAGLIEVCLILAAAYAVALSSKRRKKMTKTVLKSGLRAKASKILAGEQRFNKRTLILVFGVVIGIGLVFSASRGGLIAASGAMLCTSLLFIFRKNHRKKGFLILFLFLIIAAYAVHIGAEYTVERFKNLDHSFEVRDRFARKTMDIFEDYMITGIGVGNFRYAYPKYQAAEDKNLWIRHAHNDWAQFLAEAGIAGFCLLLAGMSYYLYRTMKLWRKRRDPFAICLGVAPLGAMVAMAIHSYVDFNLHIPANFLMLAAVTAIGYSSLHLQRRHGREKLLYRHHIMSFKYKGAVVSLLVLVLIGWAGFWTVRHFAAEAYCNTVYNRTLNRDMNPPLEEIRKAIAWDRWNAVYWNKLTLELIRVRNSETKKGNEDNEDRTKKQMEIIRASEEAVRLNPFEAEYHIRSGWEYAALWKDPDYHKKWLPSADISMDRAAYFAGEKRPYLHLDIGNYWTMRSKNISPTIPEHETAWAKAGWHYKKAQSLDKSESLRNKIVKYVWLFYPDKKMIREVLP